MVCVCACAVCVHGVGACVVGVYTNTPPSNDNQTVVGGIGALKIDLPG